MKKLLCLSLLLANTTFAQDVTIKLNAYLWSRPTAKGHELDITPHGEKTYVELFLPETLGFHQAEKKFSGDDYTATVRAFRNNKENVLAYVILQTKVTDKNGELIAECSNYSSLDFAAKMGVGACTGRVNERQVGASFARP